MHTLYSFRRCPYAIRARLAIRYAKIAVTLREIELKNKPTAMLSASPKGTVPVLITEESQVIDESLDIMLWSLKQYDPDQWLSQQDKNWQLTLIKKNDEEFKPCLDRYKYHDRHELSEQAYLQACLGFVKEIEEQLSAQRYLGGQTICLADMAIFPFIRQFAFADKQTFDQLPIPNTQCWLDTLIQSDLFINCFKKYPPWDQQSMGEPF